MADASAVADILLDAASHPRMLEILADEDGEVVVPHLCDVEVLSVLRRLVRLNETSEDRAGQALELLLDLPVRRMDHAPLLGRAFELRDNFSAYDATYVALAEGLAAPLVTADARLAGAVRTWTDVEVVEV